MHVSICTPTAGIVQVAYVASLPSLMMHYLNQPVAGREDEDKKLSSQLVVGANIGEARDNMCSSALKTDATHVLFIDDDMGFKPECLNIALSRQLPIVIGNYRRKNPPCFFTARNADNTASIVTTKDSTSLEECYFGGFGFALIERQVLEAVERPRFLMEYVPKTDCYTTEDLPFYEKCWAKGFKTFVDHEISKRIWHNGNYAFQFDCPLATEGN